MTVKRKQHTAAFKAQVAVAAVKGDRTINELASHFGVHPTLIHGGRNSCWLGPRRLRQRRPVGAADAEVRQAELYEQIGRLKMDLEWLKKKLPHSAERLRPLIEVGHAKLSVRRQCELLGLCRSSLYYEPAGETAENLRLMRLIDREYTAHPFFGSRQLTSWLIRQGEAVNRKLGPAVYARYGVWRPFTPSRG